MAGRHDAAHDIVGRIVARGHFLTLAQRALARRHIEVVGLLRRGRGFVRQAQHVGVELVSAGHAQGIGFLVKGDFVFGTVFVTANDDAGQGVFPLQPHLPFPEAFDRQHQNAGAVRDIVAPVLAARRGGWRGDDLEIGRAASIGQEIEAVGTFDNVIFDIGFAFGHQNRLAVRGIGVDQPQLRRGVRA